MAQKETVEDIEKKMKKLEEKKELLEKKRIERQTLKEEKAKDKIDELFKGKKEKDFMLTDPANVMALGIIQDFEDEDKPLHLMLDFERDNSKVKVFIDVTNGEVFHVLKNGERWGTYSKEYYDLALKVIDVWHGGTASFYVNENKDSPILISCERLGFVLAPRIETDGEEFTL